MGGELRGPHVAEELLDKATSRQKNKARRMRASLCRDASLNASLAHSDHRRRSKAADQLWLLRRGIANRKPRPRRSASWLTGEYVAAAHLPRKAMCTTSATGLWKRTEGVPSRQAQGSGQLSSPWPTRWASKAWSEETRHFLPRSCAAYRIGPNLLGRESIAIKRDRLGGGSCQARCAAEGF